MKKSCVAYGVLIGLSCFFMGWFVRWSLRFADQNRIGGKEGYREYFINASGYDGPISKYNFSYARPVEFYTIGWVKVEKADLSFRHEDVLSGKVPSEADGKFFFYEGMAICPPQGDQYINWTIESDRSKFWMAYDLDAEFLWFVDELLPE